MKNGPHCAFAHGPHDLRGPVYDIRELQGQQDDEDRLVSPLVGSLEREKGVLVDDLRWQGKTCSQTCLSRLYRLGVGKAGYETSCMHVCVVVHVSL